MKKVKIQYNTRRYREFKRYKRIQRDKEKTSYYKKLFFILFLVLILYYYSRVKKMRLERDNGETNITRNLTENNFEYFCSYISMEKKDNIYPIQLIQYYMSLGVDKFVFGNNNHNIEKLSNAFHDYIKNGTVDIFDIKGEQTPKRIIFENVYEKYKTKCKWITFLDFNEYLAINFTEEKHLTIKEYLSNIKFNKCDSISVNKLFLTDNDLINFDIKTLIERIKNHHYSINDSKYTKTIFRGDLTKSNVLEKGKNNLHSNIELYNCNSFGEKIKNIKEDIVPFRFKYSYLVNNSSKINGETTKKLKKKFPVKKGLNRKI